MFPIDSLKEAPLLAAMAYLDRAWAVIPWDTGDGTPFPWAEPRAPSKEQFFGWWKEDPEAAPGLVAGPASGLTIVYLDTDEVERLAFEVFLGAPFPETLTATLPVMPSFEDWFDRGGKLLFYQHSGEPSTSFEPYPVRVLGTGGERVRLPIPGFDWVFDHGTWDNWDDWTGRPLPVLPVEIRVGLERRHRDANGVLASVLGPQGTEEDDVDGAADEGQTETSLPFRLVTDLINETPEQPDWLWEGLIARGAITLLVGAPKGGKTTFADALIGAMGRGDPFLGRRTRRTKVVFLTEERPDTFVEKARRFELLGVEVYVLFRHETFGLSWEDVANEATRFAKEVGADLLVVDTFADWAGLRGDAENDAGAILQAMEPLKKAAGARLAVLPIHHHRKSAGEYGERVRGSSALTGVVDIIVELERSGSDDGTRILRALGRFQATPSEPLAIRLVGSEYELLGDAGDLRQARIESEQERYIEAVRALGTATAKQVAERLDVSKDTAYRSLAALHEGGKLARQGAGVVNDPYRFRLPWSELLQPH